ncbi:uncharacterized protein EV420DRAFT_1023007 [Desarmillaria tabescens]|uniref:Ricin B lectin domain-containing protein n=1 Tax=Armillaria tabescens TaxID=1929756 RepID=A0AA39JLT4_ARMTA|nr:uncharacterized protein EV420DRAFT_1023007 [Desarmillaria tabescens]KAK0443694.1 hypothetical protein EV420DRAFT_1023007 [Desarmillaria tabescens]
MYSSTILFFSALFFASAPSFVRGWCHPNFEGAALTVVWNNTLSWSAEPAVGAPISASTLPSKFFFQQNGDDPDVTYTIKTAANVNFAAEYDGQRLFMDNADWSGNENQKWRVVCNTCETDISQKHGVVASYCEITSKTDSLCITEGSGPGPLYLYYCISHGGHGNYLYFDFLV